MHKRTSGSRAAGVSPPWLEKRACRALRFVFDERTHLDKSGGRQPAVLPKNVSATASDFRTATTFARCKQPHDHGGLTPPALVRRGICLRTNAHVVADAFPCPTGGLRPPLLCCRANVCRQKAIFAMHERTLTRAAGVSPPCYRKTYLQRRAIFAQRLRKRPHNHGGLTPPAPGCTTFVRCIKRHWQCTYARRPRAAGVSPPWLGNAFAAARPLISTSPSRTVIRLGTRVCSGETSNKRKTG
jgi:hypothetical protein